MSDETYNGWTNYETWCVNLWLTNDSDGYEWLSERADEALEDCDGDEDEALSVLAEALEQQYEEFMPESVEGVFSDLLRHALGRVEWREIARYAIEDAKERAED